MPCTYLDTFYLCICVIRKLGKITKSLVYRPNVESEMSWSKKYIHLWHIQLFNGDLRSPWDLRYLATIVLKSPSLQSRLGTYSTLKFFLFCCVCTCDVKCECKDIFTHHLLTYYSLRKMMQCVCMRNWFGILILEITFLTTTSVGSINDWYYLIKHLDYSLLNLEISQILWNPLQILFRIHPRLLRIPCGHTIPCRLVRLPPMLSSNKAFHAVLNTG